MAEQTPITLPNKFPPAARVIELFIEMFKAEQEVLAGMSLLSLMTYSFDVSRIWLVGSRAWNPAIRGENAPGDKDFDLVFGEPGGAEEFCRHAHAKIVEKSPNIEYELTRNSHNGWKVKRKDQLLQPPPNDPFDRDAVYTSGAGIIDAWDLPEEHSIQEHIMGFRHDHERVAILLGCCPGEVNALTRLVRPDNHIAQQTRNSVLANRRLQAENNPNRPQRPANFYGS